MWYIVKNDITRNDYAARTRFADAEKVYLGTDKDWCVAKMREYRASHTPKQCLEFGTNRMRDGLSDWLYYYEVKTLEVTKEELQQVLLDGLWCVITRSCPPSGRTPWKRFGKNSFYWLVPALEVDNAKGRRIEWSTPETFADRREALNWMYSQK